MRATEARQRGQKTKKKATNFKLQVEKKKMMIVEDNVVYGCNATDKHPSFPPASLEPDATTCFFFIFLFLSPSAFV